LASKDGKIFQQDFENSCIKDGVFSDRIKDVYIPPEYRKKIPTVKNKYDFYLYLKPHLIPVELKSVQENRVSFSESIIKRHQIKALEEASEYEGVIAGFIFNFRSFNNRTYFVHINDFIKYKNIAENQIKEHNYKSKVNKSSIPIGICEEIGIEIKNKLLKSRYRYNVRQFIMEAVKKYEQ
jgi:penicillin-binding protein-related factor A (putative recombinase)